MDGSSVHRIVGRRSRLVAVSVGVAALAFAGVAIAEKSSSIKLSGPKTNKFGQDFTIKISGYAAAPANRIVAGEQTSTTQSCASKYLTENSRADYFSEYGKTAGKNHSFNGSVSFTATHLGSRALCAYVINSKTDKTYAHAQITWTNVPATTGGGGGTLKPAPVGQAQCQATKFADGSVVAQIAVENTDCTSVQPVEASADTARGAPYSKDGFSCSATAEGAGSPWASAWSGTYYAYSCKNGSAQVAFNWGTNYTY